MVKISASAHFGHRRFPRRPGTQIRSRREPDPLQAYWEKTIELAEALYGYDSASHTDPHLRGTRSRHGGEPSQVTLART
jgi:hypothetical protein